MTRPEPADLAATFKQTIMLFEQNRYDPFTMLLAYNISKVFDVTIEDLFDFWRQKHDWDTKWTCD